MEKNSFIFGTDPTERVVGCEIQDSELELFIEGPTGTRSEFRPHQAWSLTPTSMGAHSTALEGTNHYRFMNRYTTLAEYFFDRDRSADFWAPYDPKEGAMIQAGFTYFKGMKVADVSVLSFDIETVGVEIGARSKVLLISNTFRRAGKVERKLFAYSDYSNDREMFEAWADWVRDLDPSLIVGHNIYSFDFPYLAHCARKAGTSLRLGRDNSPIKFARKESRYRRDGSQDYTYFNCWIYGREIVDTWFLSMKYDFSRKYESYGLKQIIKQEGLEIEGRQHYDASLISRNYMDPAEWAKIRAYAEHDADDALALFDLMIPAYFYLCQSVPLPLQTLINTASGRWLNSFLIRSYIQVGASVPEKSEASEYEGAISIGNAGLYSNVFKVDVASLYPSIILQYEIHDSVKDPRAHFLRMVEHFTVERLANKKRAKETGDRYFSDLEQAQKIVINSAYGMLGAPGLHFNSPENAARITTTGRNILQTAIDFAAAEDLWLVNADTDSISVSDGEDWNASRRERFLADMNYNYPTKIRWEDDGLYERVLVLKAKNYALWDGTKLKIKGSALKASMKELALKEFIERAIGTLLHQSENELVSLYDEYAREICRLKDIRRWSSKKTITESVLNPTRTNEAKVLAAIEESDVQMGDKVRVYFAQDGSLKLQEDWSSDHDQAKLLDKLFKTIKIFEPVIKLARFPNYSLKRKSKAALESLLNQAC